MGLKLQSVLRACPSCRVGSYDAHTAWEKLKGYGAPNNDQGLSKLSGIVRCEYRLERLKGYGAPMTIHPNAGPNWRRPRGGADNRNLLRKLEIACSSQSDHLLLNGLKFQSVLVVIRSTRQLKNYK
jgi:hypothetical protein